MHEPSEDTDKLDADSKTEYLGHLRECTARTCPLHVHLPKVDHSEGYFNDYEAKKYHHNKKETMPSPAICIKPMVNERMPSSLHCPINWCSRDANTNNATHDATTSPSTSRLMVTKESLASWTSIFVPSMRRVRFCSGIDNDSVSWSSNVESVTFLKSPKMQPWRDEKIWLRTNSRHPQAPITGLQEHPDGNNLTPVHVRLVCLMFIWIQQQLWRQIVMGATCQETVYGAATRLAGASWAKSALLTSASGRPPAPSAMEVSVSSPSVTGATQPHRE